MNKAHVLLALFILLGLSAEAGADEGTLHALTPADQKNHAVFMRQLSTEQINAVTRIYPDFRILTLCKGRFSGAQRNELVLGIWKPQASKSRWKREVHRVGLIWSAKAWHVRVIDDEMEQDSNISRSFPMQWQYTKHEMRHRV